MTTIMNKQILLASRPHGEATAGNFRLIESPLSPLADGQVVVRHHFLSLDPYMRGRMDDARSYAPPQKLDAVMIGGTAGEVVESTHPDYAAGGADGRIAVCGMISGYNGEPIPMTSPALILRSRLRIEGFIVSEHMENWPDALAELGGMVATGKLKYRESIAQGVESAPEAFLGLLKGKNFEKQLVSVDLTANDNTVLRSIAGRLRTWAMSRVRRPVLAGAGSRAASAIAAPGVTVAQMNSPNTSPTTMVFFVMRPP